MKYRKLDSSGDMTFGAGGEDYYADCREAVAQSVLTRLRLWKREWYIDTEDGTPYYEQVLGKHGEGSAVQAIYKRISDTKGVTKITNLQTTYDPETRKFLIEVSFDTIYGEVTLNV